MAGPCIRQVTFNLKEKQLANCFLFRQKLRSLYGICQWFCGRLERVKNILNGLINYLYCMMILKNKKTKKKLLLLLQSQVKKSQTSRRVLREQKKLYSVMSKMEHPGVNMSSSYIVSLAVDAIKE